MFKKRGFTLIEILIALVIFAILSVIMTTGLHSILNTYGHLKGKSARFSELDVAMTVMQRDISQTVPRFVMTQDDQPEAAVLGSTSGIMLTVGGFANPLSVDKRSTLQRVGYQLQGDQLMRITSSVLDRVNNNELSYRVILTHVSALQFGYIDPHGATRSFWPLLSTQLNSLPKAVQMTMTVEGLGTISRIFMLPGGDIVSP
jgi:general secretion pathway protein J